MSFDFEGNQDYDFNENKNTNQTNKIDPNSINQNQPFQITKKIDKKRKKNLGKNPFVDTSYLPDTEREEKLKDLREKLIEEYKELD